MADESKSYYSKIHEDSSGKSKVLKIFLYPYQYKSSLHATIDKGGEVADALRTAAEQMLNDTDVEGYGIYRWNWENNSTEYPYWGDELNDTSVDVIPDKIRNFLKSDNGTGDNLYGHTGVHQVIHIGAGENACSDDNINNYGPAGAGAEVDDTDLNAFNDGRIAWSPYCTNTDLMRSAAIQETTHTCYQWSNTDPDAREHSLGTIDTWGDCSPMLAYHWDDEDLEEPNIKCELDSTAPPGGHRDALTSCVTNEIKKESK